MKVIVLMVFSIIFTFLLYLLNSGVSAEQVEHHGSMVQVTDDPIDCVCCHDGGGVAPNARYCTSNCSVLTSHSILKEYPPALKEDSYAPAESLRDKGIRLFEGKTTCVSCHDLKIKTRYHLIFENSGSAVCIGCHRI